MSTVLGSADPFTNSLLSDELAVAVGGSDKILTKTISQTEQLTLDYTNSMMGFSFAALNYREPEKNQYAYMLAGFSAYPTH